MLEKMGDFFDNRLNGYEEHQLTCIESAQELLRLKELQGIKDDEFYHYDTPLTVEHEIEALAEAGFEKVEVLNSWGATYTLKAWKCKEKDKC